MERLWPEDPRSIGGYRLLGRLGAGGMGQVYLARSDRGRIVAVKTIQPALASQPHFRQRFAQEIATARKVGGRWTAPVLDADTEGRMPWVATGYIAGPTLQRVVDDDYGPLPEPSVWSLACGLVQALRDIHGAGLVHRDLKPSNVLLTIDGPRVIDFGIARALDSVTSGGLTRTGAVIGSPGFMSPEQIRGISVTAASDIFCLGSVLAYAATGRLPFAGDDTGPHALMFRIVEAEPDLTGIPGGLRALVSRCLTKDSADRPTIAELLQATEGYEPGDRPWPPAELLAQLGKQAIVLLDSEEPDSQPGAPAPVPSAPAPQLSPAAPAALAAWTTAAPGFGPPHQPTAVATTPSPQAWPAAWPAPVAGPAGDLGLPRQPRSLTGLATALYWLFGAMLVLTYLSLGHTIEAAVKLSEWQSHAGDMVTGSLYLSEQEVAEEVATVLMLLGALLLLALAIVFWAWFWRLRVNAEFLAGPGRLRYPRGMAFWGWLIPVGMFFIPKQMANDIRAVSLGPTAGRTPLDVWWTIWVCCLAGMHVPRLWVPWQDANTYDEARTAAALNALMHVPVLAAATAAIVVVRRLTTGQHDRLAAQMT
ncbi:DUF4328 domain-containing protein [Streptomyces sp. 7-21]|uniref:protein kinase domain-containing protein n=1 Tax=Streptomyces sp. 7-21 TaxID=2802283 RepID=UPI00191F2A5E|nr:DUF4328 domain-containing protein [Streptomyces sp. 7-21]MBL1066002.1 DUF4328 domain-containing protein [Streptomyces sp. 7-21]